MNIFWYITLFCCVFLKVQGQSYMSRENYFESNKAASKLVNEYRKTLNQSNLIEISTEYQLAQQGAFYASHLCLNETFPNYHEESYPPFHDTFVTDKQPTFRPEDLIQKMIDAGVYDYSTKTCLSGDCRFALLLSSQQVYQFGCEYYDCGDAGFLQVSCYFLDTPESTDVNGNQSFFINDPYEAGAACSNCPEHHNSCYEGLCSDRKFCPDSLLYDASWCGWEANTVGFPGYDGKECPCTANNQFLNQCVDDPITCWVSPNLCTALESYKYKCPKLCKLCFDTEIPINSTTRDQILAFTNFGTLDSYNPPSKVDRRVRNLITWSDYLANFSRSIANQCSAGLDGLELNLPAYSDPIGIAYDVDSYLYPYNPTTHEFGIHWGNRMRFMNTRLFYGENYSSDPNATRGYLCQNLTDEERSQCNTFSLLLNENVTEMGCSQYMCPNPKNSSQSISRFVCLLNGRNTMNLGRPTFEYYASQSPADAAPACPPGTVWKRYFCAPTTLRVPSKNGTCLDFDPECYAWAQAGKCDAFPLHFGALCPRSCNVCQGDTNTDDFCNGDPLFHCGQVFPNVPLFNACHQPQFAEICPTDCTMSIEQMTCRAH